MKGMIENDLIDVRTLDKLRLNVRYYCNFKGCSRVYKRKGLLKNHQLKAHSNIKTVFRCEICQKEFSFQKYLSTHLLIHSAIKRYSCKYCDKRFSTMSNKNDHQRRHL